LLFRSLQRATLAVSRHAWRAGGAFAFALLVAVGVWHWANPTKPRGFELKVAVPGDGDGLSLALYQSLGLRLAPGHTVDVLENGAVFESLERDIRTAKTSLHLLFYIWEKGVASDRISSALEARARAGVKCRIVVDDLGSPDFGRDVEPVLVRAGCDVRVFRPKELRNTLARNHRKLAIIDGMLAYTGGFGIRDNWLGDGKSSDHWRETSVP
jgi:cardiolipin synthase